jgi:potassium-transporting ATPase KdpC subunit
VKQMLTVRQIGVAIRLLLAATVVLGIAYPLAITGAARLLAPDRAGGSLVADDSGRVVGSRLIGQAFTQPQWFWPRPSAAGADGYDAMASGGSNLAADNPTLIEAVTTRKQAAADTEGVAVADVPADAVTASGSGLDPHISPAYAYLQVDRVAAARGLDPDRLRELVATHVQGRELGFIGEERVNVLELNLALQSLS